MPDALSFAPAPASPLSRWATKAMVSAERPGITDPRDFAGSRCRGRGRPRSRRRASGRARTARTSPASTPSPLLRRANRARGGDAPRELEGELPGGGSIEARRQVRRGLGPRPIDREAGDDERSEPASIPSRTSRVSIGRSTVPRRGGCGERRGAGPAPWRGLWSGAGGRHASTDQGANAGLLLHHPPRRRRGCHPATPHVARCSGTAIAWFRPATARRPSRRFADEDVDLVVLDVMLPRASMASRCAGGCAAARAGPIMMLTARDAEVDKVRGLEPAPTTTSPSRSRSGSSSPGRARCCAGQRPHHASRAVRT